MIHCSKICTFSIHLSNFLSSGHLHIVEHLISQRELVGKQERIDALELLGATFVDKKRDMLGALKLWKRAMEER